MLTIINHNLLSALDRHAPVREIVQKRPPAPWVNNYIIQKMKQRDRVRRAWRRHGKPEFYEAFKRLRNLVQSQIREAKEKYYLTALKGKQGPSSTWGELKHLGLLGSLAKNRCNFDLNELNSAFTSSSSQYPEVRPVHSALCSSPGDLGQFDETDFFFADILPKTIRDYLQR
ncbi:reverse transcriptase [Lasius niger]|uniref:Reverse transcriptase n=1 Tax=Lasius niger TaxID=67767 RepID=A0A0J7JTW9_LASNI|nr:reverse transcriptase [Lasius niger]